MELNIADKPLGAEVLAAIAEHKERFEQWRVANGGERR